MPLKKIFLFLFCLLGFVVVGYAQDSRIWATYYGGENDDYGFSLTTDDFGNIYLAGRTQSISNIALGGFQDTIGGGDVDAFIVKFDSTGNRLWATYYGGTGADIGQSIATDSWGNIYLTGYTTSNSGISWQGFQNTYSGGRDAFIVKFDSSGNRIWATYYGGNNSDSGEGIVIDDLGNVYLAGYTNTNIASIIASDGFQNIFGGGSNDAFLVKFDSFGNRIWATYYGGTDSDVGTSLDIDNNGNIYLGGITKSDSNISSGGFQNTYGGGYEGDAFVVKFDSTGNRLWATYYGGQDGDLVNSVATDTFGNLFLAGYTYSPTGIASGGFQNILVGNYDAFLVKFDSSGNRLWGTYYGGTSAAETAATDQSGNVYLAGDTYNHTGIADGGFQNILIGQENEFVVKFDSSGNRFCGTYYGQLHEEEGHATVDLNGNLYLYGFTNSITGIASDGFQNSFGGGNYDAFVVKLTTCPSCQTSFAINISQNGDTLFATTAPYYQWYFNDTLIPNATNQNYVITSSGYYYAVTIYDSCKIYSNIIETTCLCVGISENSIFQNISIFPNPANEQLNIIVQLSNAEAATIKLIDAFGRKVYEKEETQKAASFNWQIPLSSFAAGIYFAEITVLGQKQYLKIAVQR